METLRNTLLALVLCFVSSAVQAQDGEAIVLVSPGRRGDARAELEAVDRQADLATAGYVTSAILHVGGLVMAVAGIAGGSCVSLSIAGPGPGCSSNALTWNLLAGSGIGLSVAGLAGIFISIGVDVGSGRARDAWREHFGLTNLALSVAPSDDGAILTVAGRF